MPGPSPTHDRTLAAKIDHLFRTVRPPSGKEYSFEEVAETVRAGGGPTISGTYLWQLRKGLRDNPTRRHLEALAGFFGVPPAYFFDDDTTRQVDAELALIAALRDASVRQIAMRAAGLSPRSLGAITEMVERAREIEGLPDPPAPDPPAADPPAHGSR
ncbi:helix-turn-helix domain-containing protein [Saccharothrix australiensis]|uniref:Transcriptional regulator with XRE-family HTH domain n=1 Tax=Saccharothrix australiensis TaxID=2072 RepID=A0A495VZB1_9PSEU|nr:helix-turn-helix domain-containing protein [Saccharothrix australiensis]RKT54686.1 transcriptional regulator with XRE-family HTH domain [Saccharothrix australiensis]